MTVELDQWSGTKRASSTNDVKTGKATCLSPKQKQENWVHNITYTEVIQNDLKSEI